MNKWEKVYDNEVGRIFVDVDRLAVPGGWLYHVHYYTDEREHSHAVFVPDAGVADG